VFYEIRRENFETKSLIRVHRRLVGELLSPDLRSEAKRANKAAADASGLRFLEIDLSAADIPRWKIRRLRLHGSGCR